MNTLLGRVEDLARRQHDVVAVWQLRARGWTGGQIKAGLRGLRRVHRGVCATGDLTELGWFMAAALAGGPGAVVSHLSALQLMELRPLKPGDIHVTLPRRSGAINRDGIVFHRALEAAQQRAIEVTLLDDVSRLKQAVRGFTRSDSEALFLWRCHRWGLPLPQVNQHLNGYETDFHWPELRLVVEVDGHEHHRERPQFNRDRYRGLVHRARGWEVVRISADHVHDEPELILDALVPQTFGGPSSRSSRWSNPGRDSPPNLSARRASRANGPKT